MVVVVPQAARGRPSNLSEFLILIPFPFSSDNTSFDPPSTIVNGTDETPQAYCERLCGTPTAGGWIPQWEWCQIGRYTEDVSKYWGVCFDELPLPGQDDVTSLDDNYRDEAWRYLAYYTLTKSPKYCAGTGTAPGSSEINSALSSAFWYTSLVPSTVHDIISGIQYWINHPELKVNLARDGGMKWSSLSYDGVYSENQAGTIFVSSLLTIRRSMGFIIRLPRSLYSS